MNQKYLVCVISLILFGIAQFALAAPVYIQNFSDFPEYPYNTSGYIQSGRYVGCGPTTGAMILGYFHHVEGMSGSTGLLTSPVSGVDEGLNTAWALHSSDYMKTNSSGFGSPYDIEPGMEGYAADRGYEIDVLIHVSPTYDPSSTAWDAYGPYGTSWLNDGDFWQYSSGSWDFDKSKFCDFVADKLANGVTVFLAIDTDLDGGGDHWVPLVGYDRTTYKYYFYDTYSTTLRSADIHYCGAPGPKKDNAISFVRTVTYIGPAGTDVKPPKDLVALSGYFGSVPLAWNKPKETTRMLSRPAKDSPESKNAPKEFNITQENEPDVLFSSILQWVESADGEAGVPDVPDLTNSSAFLGFNVYRSSSSGGPFTKIANQITRQYFLDKGAGINTTNYYRVTAVYNEGESTPTSTVSATTKKNGYHIEAGWANSPPTMNGKIGSSEWSSATEVKITYPGYSGIVSMYVMNDADNLYLAVHDGRDNSLENLDQFALFFDENIDREWPKLAPSGEGVIWIAWNGSTRQSFSVWGGRYGYWPDHIGLETNVTTPKVTHGMSLASGYVEYEGTYNLSSSPLNASPGSKIGILVFICDYDPKYFNAFWPQEVVRLEPITNVIDSWGTGPFSYGTLILATEPVSTTPDIAVTPSSWNFGDVNVGSSKDKVFEVRNEGDATLSVSSISLSGDVSSFYVIDGGGTSSIPAGGTHNVTIRFKPPSAGSKTVQARIYSNDPDENPFTVNLTGTGVTIQPPVLHVSPINLDFGTSQNSLAFNISNTGAGTLSWTVEEAPDKPWITSVSPTSGTNAGTVTVTVDRAQLTPSSDTGVIRVASNGGTQDVEVHISKSTAPLPDHWNFTENTGNSATIVLPTSASPNIDGAPLQNGDYIGMFTPAGLCCGWKIWTGSNMSITAWGDDNQTPEIDGLRSGERIHYRVWRGSMEKEWLLVETEYSQGNGLYAANAFMVLSRFDVLDQRCMMLDFNAGWNMFSLNIAPGDPDIGVVLASVLDDLVLVKDGAGNTFIPMYAINDIGAIEQEKGFQAYFSAAASQEVCGQPIAPDMPMHLSAGWSLISYLPDNPMDAAIALASIESQLVLAKNNQGQTYIPMYGINDIGAMQPCQGYQVYLKGAATLTYPTGGLAKERPEPSVATHFQFSDRTGENATIVMPEAIRPRYAHGAPLATGDEIGVFTADGRCCGSAVWNSANCAITIWADDSKTDEIDGAVPGELLHVRVWQKSTNAEYVVAGNRIEYQRDGYSVLNEFIAQSLQDVNQAGDLAAPSDFRLCQNYPNPFNPETRIDFDLPQKATVTLAIYDLQGRLIRTLIQGEKAAGHYVAVWNSRTDSGEKAPSGVYVYRLTAGTHVSNKKMILLK